VSIPAIFRDTLDDHRFLLYDNGPDTDDEDEQDDDDVEDEQEPRIIMFASENQLRILKALVNTFTLMEHLKLLRHSSTNFLLFMRKETKYLFHAFSA
jgi:hypothetical protein